MKKILVLLISFALLFAIVGCQTEDVDTEPVVADDQGQEMEEVVEHYPLTATDCNGNEVTLEQKPESIVSLTLGSDEMLLAMVDPATITAICGAIAEDDGISNIADIAKNFDKAENNIEVIISMGPDIVFASSWMDQGMIQQLVDAKIPVYCVSTPNNLDEQKAVVAEIANVVGEVDNGQKLIDEMNQILKNVNDKVSSLSDDQKVRVLSYNTYGSTNGIGTTFDDICQKAGVINAAAEAGIEQWGDISKESIVEINPDVLILPFWSYEGNDPNDFKEQIMNDPSFSTVEAVINDRVYMLPDKHTSAVSQYMAVGVEDLAKVVYPDLFK